MSDSGCPSWRRSESWGSMVREARMRRGWTQAELARRIGVRPQAVCLWERGRNNATLFMRKCAEDALGIEVDCRWRERDG